MGQYRYVTNRTVPNKTGDKMGTIRVMVLKDSDKAQGDYSCPECDHHGKVDQVFKRPFSVRCHECNALMKIPKLKGKKS